MRAFHVTIAADRYPTDYRVEASDWPTAIARAVKLWKKRFRGSKAQELSIRAVKGASNNHYGNMQELQS